MQRLICAVFAAVLVATSPTRAVVLFNNFGPNDSYLGNTGWTVSNGVDLMVHLEQAARFTVSGGDHFLTSVELAMGHLFGPNVLHVTLHSESAGGPGAVLQTVTVLNQILPLPTEPQVNNPPIVANFGSSTVLANGGAYWISLSSDTVEPNSWLVWNYNITGDMGTRAHRTDGGPWQVFSGQDPRGTFRINGTPVPEPTGALAFVLAGALTLVARRAPSLVGTRRA